MTYLIDTDIVIDHLAGDQTGSTLLLNTLGPSGIAISNITYTEVYVGILRSPSSGQRRDSVHAST
jgi:predicted nucleic acid-binding protein